MHRFETGHSENVNHDINTIEETKTGGRRKFALIGGVIVVIAIAVYIVASVYPSQLFSKSEDGGPIEQHQPAFNAHPVLPASPLKTSSEAIFASTDQVWNKIFKQMGKTYTKPGLQLFQDTITAGGCGFVKPATAPFYCPADKVIYVDLDFFAAIKNKYSAASDLAEAYAIAHQQGHYIQDLLGTTGKAEAQQGSMNNADYHKQLDKLELQADFYAGVWAHYAYKHPIEQADAEFAMSSTTQIANLLEQKNDRVLPDPYSHSNVAERTRWFTIGYQTGDMKLGDKVFAEGDLK